MIHDATYYTGPSCESTLGNFNPDCSGECISTPNVQSVFTIGTLLPLPLGTACAFYSDGNCQNEVGSTENDLRDEMY